MRLHLELPESWARSGPETVSGPGFVLHVLPLVPHPPDGEAWMTRMMGAELPADHRLDEEARDDIESRDGWSMRIVQAAVRDAAGGVVETHVWGFFELGPYVGAAWARGRGPDWVADVVEALKSGRPDWRGDDVVSVPDFYR